MCTVARPSSGGRATSGVLTGPDVSTPLPTMWAGARVWDMRCLICGAPGLILRTLNFDASIERRGPLGATNGGGVSTGLTLPLLCEIDITVAPRELTNDGEDGAPLIRRE